MIKYKFQFHNGTINTTSAAGGNLLPYSFNSTTVQLIRYIHIVFALMQVFQFHNGTINTKSCKMYFKSSIVSIPQRYN